MLFDCEYNKHHTGQKIVCFSWFELCLIDLTVWYWQCHFFLFTFEAFRTFFFGSRNMYIFFCTVDLITSPQTCVWERGIVLLVWVCLSVCLSVCNQDNSKSSRLISMKFGRKLGYPKRKAKSILTRIAQIERKPRPKEIFKMPHL